MGPRGVDKTKKIEQANKRDVTYCKRRRGLLKKCVEMSKMCDQKVFMVIYDPLK